MEVAAASQHHSSSNRPPPNLTSPPTSSPKDPAPGRSSNSLSVRSNSMTSPYVRASTRHYVSAKSTTISKSITEAVTKPLKMILFSGKSFSIFCRTFTKTILSFKGYLNIKTFHFNHNMRQLPSSFYEI